MLDRAEIRPGQRVLEIGCGTGNLLAALAVAGLTGGTENGRSRGRLGRLASFVFYRATGPAEHGK